MSRASDKQLAFIRTLCAEREGGDAFVTTALPDSRSASALIGQLLKLPRRADVAGRSIVSETGMYRLADGSIVKVQAAKESGNLYAKRLASINGSRLSETDARVQWEFVYEPGLIKQVQPESKLTLEEAREFGIQYGVCCNCGARLSDAESVAQGIGPVCAKQFSARSGFAAQLRESF